MRVLAFLLALLLYPAIAIAEQKPTAASRECKSGSCPSKWSRGISVTAGTVACLDEVSTSTRPELLPTGTQLVWWADQTCACFWSWADPWSLSISMTTLEVTDSVTNDEGIVGTSAPDGSAGAVALPANQRAATVLGPPSDRATNPMVTGRTGVCVDGNLVTDGRPCRVDGDCVNSLTCYGDGITAAQSASMTSAQTGGFFCCDCSSNGTVRANSE